MSFNQDRFPNENLDHFTDKSDRKSNTANRQNAHKQRRTSARYRISRDFCAKNKHEQQTHDTDEEIIQDRSERTNQNTRRSDQNRDDKFGVKNSSAVCGENCERKSCLDCEEQ